MGNGNWGGRKGRGENGINIVNNIISGLVNNRLQKIIFQYLEVKVLNCVLFVSRGSIPCIRKLIKWHFFLHCLIFDVVRVRWHSQQSTLCQEVRSLLMGSGVSRTRKQVGAGSCMAMMTAVDSAQMQMVGGGVMDRVGSKEDGGGGVQERGESCNSSSSPLSFNSSTSHRRLAASQ